MFHGMEKLAIHVVSVAYLLLIFPVLGIGQMANNQLWTNYALTIETNSDFSYGGDVGLR